MAVAEPLDLTLDVLAVEALSPSLTRVRLGGAGLAAFRSLDVPDEACVFGFPGVPVEADPRRGGARWYTVRRVEPAALVVDIVRHPGGIGAAWADRALVGDRLTVTHQNSWFRRPADATWQVLLGDLTGLPALGRIVEETPAHIATTAVVELADRADVQTLRAVPGCRLDVDWVVNPGLHRSSELEKLARGLDLPPGPGYVYCVGEAAATRAVRRYLRHDLGLPAARYGVLGYWRTEGERWEQRAAASEHDTGALYQEAVAAGRDEEEVRDLYERRLAEVGLL